MKKPKRMPGPRAGTAAALARVSGKEFPTTRAVNLKLPMPPGGGPFGEGPDTDPGDSERLRRLRNIIDDKIGWACLKEEEDGDYEARLMDVAAILRQLRFVRWSHGKVLR
jgi:hypothetical protein